MRALVAADHHLVTRGIATAIRTAHADWPVREARTAQECLRITDSWGPDVVVLSVDLPTPATGRLIQDLGSRALQVVCVVEGSRQAVTALVEGADAVVSEADGIQGIVASVEQAAMGRSYVSGDLLTAVLHQLVQRAAPGPGTAADRDVARLSERERAVLGLLRAGHDRNAIAEQLGIAPQTAKTHIRHVLQKLGVHSRREAAAIAEDSGVPVPRTSGPDGISARALPAAGGAELTAADFVVEPSLRR